MKKPPRKNRADQLVTKARHDIAKIYELPVESIRFVLPRSGRLPKDGKTIGQLREDWDKHNLGR